MLVISKIEDQINGLTHWGWDKMAAIFSGDIFLCIFLNGNVWILIKVLLKFIPEGPNNNNPASVQVRAWCRPGNKPLSEPMMVRLLTHICITQPQWVNIWLPYLTPLSIHWSYCSLGLSHRYMPIKIIISKSILNRSINISNLQALSSLKLFPLMDQHTGSKWLIIHGIKHGRGNHVMPGDYKRYLSPWWNIINEGKKF